MPSEVILIERAILQGLRKSVNAFAKSLPAGQRVAIKMHMGEGGSLFYLRPIYARTVADELKSAGMQPFVFDSPTMYHGNRHDVESYYETAKKNGFTEESVGCPIIISDEGVPVSTALGKINVCKKLVDAKAMVVLSHFKGHLCSTYGGAIKNLGMGGFTSASKKRIHNGCTPAVDLAKCVGCGTCAKACPFGLPKVKGKVQMPEACYGCCVCVLACPQHALKPRTMPLAEGLSDVVSHLLKSFPTGNVLYVNVLMDIATRCDCVAHGESDAELAMACPNIGIMVSSDPVAVDKASLDIVDELSAGKFGKLWGGNPDWQTEKAEALGMGFRKYVLKRA